MPAHVGDSSVAAARVETFDGYWGMVNVPQKPPLIEAGGKFWCTIGGVIAVMYDSVYDRDFANGVQDDEFPWARLPSGTVAVGPRGERVVVP